MTKRNLFVGVNRGGLKENLKTTTEERLNGFGNVRSVKYRDRLEYILENPPLTRRNETQNFILLQSIII